MGGRFFKGVVFAATTGIGVALATPMAAQAAVVCGQTITSSMTLDADLTCTGSGIFINANNVVLDLAGHTINGPAPTGTGGGPRGIVILQNRSGVTVRNGVVHAFDNGVDVLPGVSASTISGLILDSNGLGIRVNTGAFSDRMTDNVIVDSTSFSGIQMGGNGHVVQNNTFNNVFGSGVFLSGNNNVIRENKINGAGGNAITIGAFPSNPGPFVGNQVIGNRSSGAGRNFNSTSMSVVNGSGTLFQSNVVNGRQLTPGIIVVDSANTEVSDNTLVNDSTGVLVRGTSAGTKVLRNTTGQNVFSGINVENGPTATVLSDNLVSGNGGNGISVSGPGTTIARNTAISNGNWGIFAVSGSIDGGGNKAFNNANPAQCTPNIVCT
jgi:parallel beta-helix repeat protein